PDPQKLELITAPVAEKMNLGLSMEDAKKLVNTVIEKHGKIDALITNYDEFKAAKKRVDQYTVEDYDKIIEINVNAVFRLLGNIRQHFRDKADSDEQGTILIMTSIAGKAGLDIGTLYSAAKGAVNGMIRSIAKEFGRFANVNGIAQGYYAAKKNSFGPKDRVKKNYMITSSARSKKPLTFEDVAPLAALLVSDDAKMISGQIYNVDGGLWIHVQA
ncbi:MAG: SDR family NAD(P)-dependent oxidoreductase, partial [Promethearchaeota archaeon]